jgi:hypothetical protein
LHRILDGLEECTDKLVWLVVSSYEVGVSRYSSEPRQFSKNIRITFEGASMNQHFGSVTWEVVQFSKIQVTSTETQGIGVEIATFKLSHLGEF